MLYEEWVDLLGSEEVTRGEYTEIIEPVYTWHPMFETGKDIKGRLVRLYNMGGLEIFKEMRAVADECMNLGIEIEKAKERTRQAMKYEADLVAERAEILSKYERHKGK